MIFQACSYNDISHCFDNMAIDKLLISWFDFMASD